MTMLSTCAVLDTGAGRNFMDLSRVLNSCKNQIENSNIPAVLDENRNTLRIIGYIYLWVLLGSQITRERLYVCRNLAAPYTLGCAYLNRNVHAILPLKRQVKMKNGSVARILTSRQFPKQIRLSPNPNSSIDKVSERKATLKQNPSSPVQVTKRISVPADHQVWVDVVCSVSGPCVIEPSIEIFRKNHLSTPNSVTDTEPNAPIPNISLKFWPTRHLPTKRHDPSSRDRTERAIDKRIKLSPREFAWDMR